MKFSVAICLLGALFVNAAPPSSPNLKADASVNYVLERSFVPEEYKIRIETYLADIYLEKDRFVFNGSCAMKFKYVGSEANPQNFTIHARNLKNISYELYEIINGTELKKEITFSEPHNLTDQVKIKCDSGFRSGIMYLLKSSYIGQMDDDMHGFYRSQYEDDQGRKEWLASTQFEPNDARRAFPCFDEPFFKAGFRLIISRHKSYNVEANTRLQSSVKDPSDANRFIDSFELTPIISSYIVAFLVSKFQNRSDGFFSVLSRPAFYPQTEYAIEVAPKTLHELDVYTDIEYRTIGGGNNKMTMAAIPDFSAGAMENWGLVTYRESSLLLDPKESSLKSRQTITTTIAHEQAHMWFGNLVTCDWWSNTWLNEGFANYFQHYAANAAFPTYQLSKQFPVDVLQNVLVEDSLPGAKPMTDPSVATPADMARMFNRITYNKGGSIIRNIKYIMGDDNFQKGIREYLKEKSFKNANPDQLFEILDKYWPPKDKAMIGNTTKFLKSWTEQPGYPVVQITLDKSGKSFSATQKRFLLKDDKNVTITNHIVPLTFTTSTEKNFEDTSVKAYLNSSEEIYTFELSKKTNYIIANVQETGYYRVNYDEKSWAKIEKALLAKRHSDIHEINRASLIDDYSNFARAGVVPYDRFLKMIEFIKNDANYISWTAAYRSMSFLASRMTAKEKSISHFSNFIQSITGKNFKKLGFEKRKDDTTLDIYLRSNTLDWSCKFDNKKCIKQAKKYFADSREKRKFIDPDIRQPVYCSVLRENGPEDLEFLYQKSKHETIATEQTLLVTVMGCVSSDDLVAKVYNITLNETRLQDKPFAIRSLYTSNDGNVMKTFNLIAGTYKEYDKAMGSKGSSASTIADIAAFFTSEEEKQKLIDFKNDPVVRSYYGKKLVEVLDNAVEAVNYNLNWSDRLLGPALSYLGNRYKKFQQEESL